MTALVVRQGKGSSEAFRVAVKQLADKDPTRIRFGMELAETLIRQGRFCDGFFFSLQNTARSQDIFTAQESLRLFRMIVEKEPRYTDAYYSLIPHVSFVLPEEKRREEIEAGQRAGLSLLQKSLLEPIGAMQKLFLGVKRGNFYEEAALAASFSIRHSERSVRLYAIRLFALLVSRGQAHDAAESAAKRVLARKSTTNPENCSKRHAYDLLYAIAKKIG